MAGECPARAEFYRVTLELADEPPGKAKTTIEPPSTPRKTNMEPQINADKIKN
jgi:hypothetical protein